MCLIYLNYLYFNSRPNVSHRNKSHTQCGWYMWRARSSKSNNWLYFMFYSQEEYAFIFSWNVIFWSGTPKCSSDKSSSEEIEENELRLAAGSVDLTRVLFWPGKLWEFSCESLILYVLENNPVEQVSEAAKSAQPKSITVCIRFHLAHLHQQTFGH